MACLKTERTEEKKERKKKQTNETGEEAIERESGMVVVLVHLFTFRVGTGVHTLVDTLF
jgi:flagellar biosynthesis protein FlhB